MKIASLVWGTVVLVSCGGGKGKDPTAAPPPSAIQPSVTHHEPDDDHDEVAPSAKAAAAAATQAAPPHPPGGPVTLDGLFDKSAQGFPKKTASDKDCYRTVGLTGKGDADYASVIAACGAPTGMKEYTKTVTGKLDAKHPRDTYVVKMLGGFCYRFYAIGDATMGNLDIRVQRPTGALVSMDQSKQAVAMLDPDAPWCKSHDREFHFVVETVGGNGSYTFGVWARPK